MIQNGVLEQYIGRDRVIIVPDGVEKIADNTFKACIFLEEVTLPETIVSIGKNAFKGCKRLKQINFPKKLEKIGEYAFHRCHSLQYVELPSSVTYLEHCTFLYCDSLISARIPGVVGFGKQVFLNDIYLEELEVSNELDLSSICDVFTGCSRIFKIAISNGEVYQLDHKIEVLERKECYPNVVFEIVKDIYRMMEIQDGILTKFLTNLREVEIPEGIRGIGKSCFFDKKGIVMVTIPKSVTHIQKGAFRNCINLQKIIFHNTMVSIEKDAFKNCSSLKYLVLRTGEEYELKGLDFGSKIQFPELVQKIHNQILSNFYILGTTLVQYLGMEERVEVPEGITVIGERAFAGNEAIGRVILPESVKEIKEEAFEDCLLLQTIELPEELRSIGKCAFENCVKLLHIKLPNTITEIETSVFNRCQKLGEIAVGTGLREIKAFAFYGCHALKEFHFPEELQYIGDMAFYQCDSLKEVNIPKSIQELGNQVFTLSGIKNLTIQGEIKKCGKSIVSYCKRLKQITFMEGVETIYDKFAFSCLKLNQVDLPTTINKIGTDVFYGSEYIKNLENGIAENRILFDGGTYVGEVKLSNSITLIAGGAFYGNSHIASVIFTNQIRFIGARAFCGCTSIRKIELPEKIVTLSEGMFAYCNSLEKISSKGMLLCVEDRALYQCEQLREFPFTHLKEIGKSAFEGCKMLEIIRIEKAKIQEDAFRRTKFLEQKQKESSMVILGDTLIDGTQCEHEVVIPEGVAYIASSAFYTNCFITSVIFPKSLIAIEDCAFLGCKNLKEIVIQSELTFIGRSAFEKCITLTHVYGLVYKLKERAFFYCVSLEKIHLPVTKFLGEKAFFGCKKLKFCKVEENVSVQEECFGACQALQICDMPFLSYIGVAAFANCDSLKEISLKEKSVIADHAFEDCGRLEKIQLQSLDCQYGSYAFSGCTNLKIIQIGNTTYHIDSSLLLPNRSVPTLVQEIYYSTISCFGIKNGDTIYEYRNQGSILIIPNYIKRIEREVFKDVIHLTQVCIPESVDYIGARAFQGTNWLKQRQNDCPLVIVNDILIDGSQCMGEVVIPESVRTISGWAFANCFGLKKIMFSSNQIIVEEYAFRNCIFLNEIEMPNGNCYTFHHIKDQDLEMPDLVKQIIKECYNCFKVNEQNELIECTGNISNLAFVDGITAIKDEVFKESNLLTQITFSKDVYSIGERAFEQCKWLSDIYHANFIQSIGKRAFSGCIQLKRIDTLENLIYLGMGAFENCTSLESIVIPEGITELPERVFYRCKNLIHITLPSTLEVIGKEAFAFCSALKNLSLPVGLKKIHSRAFAWCSNLTIEENGKEKDLVIEADAFSFSQL